MNIYLTLDYEIYFGEPTGTARKCIVEPTEQLLDIAERTGVPMTYFVDIGYILQLENYKSGFRKLHVDFELVKNQIRRMVEHEQDVQLHIHPHWEDSFFDGKRWNIDVTRYRLADFEDTLIHTIVERYKHRLNRITDQPVIAHRAGGWCLQPFKKVRKALESNGLLIDSTVFPGGFKKNENYFYDFRTAPDKSKYRFSTDLVEEDPEGPFTELPIASYTYSPLFFWKLFSLGRFNPRRHKPIGDGKPIPGGGSKKELLTRSHNLPVSLDGYFAGKLDEALAYWESKGYEDFVVIGHPKACTEYSLDKLEEFIVRNQGKHTFKRITDGVTTDI